MQSLIVIYNDRNATFARVLALIQRRADLYVRSPRSPVWTTTAAQRLSIRKFSTVSTRSSRAATTSTGHLDPTAAEGDAVLGCDVLAPVFDF
jgi:hypothetical protein